MRLRNGTSISLPSDSDLHWNSHSHSHSSSARKLHPYELALQELHTLHSDILECSICLDTIHDALVVPECQHRFCGKCIQESLSKCRNECPKCRTHISTRRGLKKDPEFDALVTSVTNVKNFLQMQAQNQIHAEEMVDVDMDVENSKLENKKMKSKSSSGINLGTQIVLEILPSIVSSTTFTKKNSSNTGKDISCAPFQVKILSVNGPGSMSSPVPLNVENMDPDMGMDNTTNNIRESMHASGSAQENNSIPLSTSAVPANVRTAAGVNMDANRGRGQGQGQGRKSKKISKSKKNITSGASPVATQAAHTSTRNRSRSSSKAQKKISSKAASKNSMESIAKTKHARARGINRRTTRSYSNVESEDDSKKVTRAHTIRSTPRTHIHSWTQSDESQTQSQKKSPKVSSRSIRRKENAVAKAETETEARRGRNNTSIIMIDSSEEEEEEEEDRSDANDSNRDREHHKYDYANDSSEERGQTEQAMKLSKSSALKSASAPSFSSSQSSSSSLSLTSRRRTEESLSRFLPRDAFAMELESRQKKKSHSRSLPSDIVGMESESRKKEKPPSRLLPTNHLAMELDTREKENSRSRSLKSSSLIDKSASLPKRYTISSHKRKSSVLDEYEVIYQYTETKAKMEAVASKKAKSSTPALAMSANSTAVVTPDRALSIEHSSSQQSVPSPYTNTLRGKRSRAKTSFFSGKYKEIYGDTCTTAASSPHTLKHSTRRRVKLSGSQQLKSKNASWYTLDADVSIMITWDVLKTMEGWDYVKLLCPRRKGGCFWYYVRPGIDEHSQDTILDKDYFVTKERAIDYAVRHPECLKAVKYAPPRHICSQLHD